MVDEGLPEGHVMHLGWTTIVSLKKKRNAIEERLNFNSQCKTSHGTLSFMVI